LINDKFDNGGLGRILGEEAMSCIKLKREGKEDR
jgi:hypothetical protein